MNKGSEYPFIQTLGHKELFKCRFTVVYREKTGYGKVQWRLAQASARSAIAKRYASLDHSNSFTL
ncbi:MAG: hypothetical protein QNJ53_02305 [Pleurocapsa sp. MO_192.B19]|nr:hypothetical protein [Pleurocapsa sp. MO_192.B19]